HRLVHGGPAGRTGERTSGRSREHVGPSSLGRDNRSMDERLQEIESRYDELSRQMSAPDVASDPARLRDLGKAIAELEEVVLPFRKYRTAMAEAEEARALATQESDPESATYFREEAERAGAEAAKLRAQLEQLLVPKDPNDDKDVLVEIRAGTGGQEAALWAAEL